MKIAVYGKGHVGGGLATLWEQKGHEVLRLGREGGDVGRVQVVWIAVPGNKMAEAVGRLKGIEGGIRKIENERAYCKVVQHQFRFPVPSARAGPCEAEQFMVWRRGGPCDGRTTVP